MPEPEQFHPLLKRQISEHLPDKSKAYSIESFLKVINSTYLSNEGFLRKNTGILTDFLAAPDIFFRIDSSGKILDYKPGSIKTAQLFPDQLIGSNLQDITILKIDLPMIQKVWDNQELLALEHTITTQTNTIYFEIAIKSFFDDQAIIIFRDISDRILAKKKLPFNALHDALTLLPNRILLYDRLMYFIKRHMRNPDYNFAVLFIDFDRFKIINDSLGHQAGDKLLVDIGRRLLEALRGVDIASRFGGDEFCVILDEIKNEDDVVKMISRLQKIMASPFFVGKKEIFLSMSIGIVISSEQERSPDDYIRDADIAMYNAKNNGKSQFILFNKEMHHQAIKMMDLEEDLHKAINNNEFELYYQPILSLKNKNIMRLEALIRWPHPQKGLIFPNDFIPIAEQTGLIIRIGEFVLKQACIDCKKWQGEGFPDLGVAVNCSALQFRHINLLPIIKESLEKTLLDPSYLEIEITESVAMQNIEFTKKTLQKLKEINVEVAIDDFGTGYSSLSSLIEFPIDSLKVDRKFIKDININKSNNSLTLAIIGLAHSLGIKVVGEGIETNDQLEFLTNSKCDEGQGYLFSKPMSLDKIIPVLKKLNIPVKKEA